MDEDTNTPLIFSALQPSMAMDGARKIHIHLKETQIIDLPKPRNLTQFTQKIHQIPQDSSSIVLWTCLDLDPVILKRILLQV